MPAKQSNKLVIDILSDVVCPWCVIAYYRLLSAIRTLGIESDVDIRWHPFELNPDMPGEGENLREHLAQKYGTTLNGSIEARRRLADYGQEVGFSFNYFNEMRMYNTRKAHLLLQFAEGFEKQTALAEAFFKAYFSDQKDVSNSQVLLELVQSVGLDSSQAENYLHNSDSHSALIELEKKRLSAGFHGVPVIILNNKQTLSGAQDIDTYLNVLKSLQEQKPRGTGNC